MIKEAGKRFISLMLALIMVFSLLPVQALAAQTEAQPIENKLKVTVNGNNNDASLELIDGKIVITNPYTSSTWCGSTTYSGGKATVTITNISGNDATISFKYSDSTNINGSVTVTGATNTNGAVSGTVPANGTITVEFTGVNEKKNATLTLSDFDIVEKQTVSLTLKIPANGSYTVGGVAITAESMSSVETTEAKAVVATPADGYSFSGWYNEQSGKYLSFEANTSIVFSEATSLVPKFIPTSDGVFGIKDAVFASLDDALAAATPGSVIVQLKDVTLTKSYTIPATVTLLIPYDDANTLGGEDPAYAEIPSGTTSPTCKVYRKLTMAPNTRITVNGALELGAKHYASHGGTTIGGTPITGYGQIDMGAESAIVVNGGGKLFAWGYITGSGTVTAESGAKIYEKMQVSDYRGGSITSQIICCGVFPFNQYYIQNVEVRETLKAGATLIGHAVIYGSGLEASTIDFMGGESAMFNLSSGSITKYYNATEDRLELDVNGTVSMNSISIMGYNTSGYTLPFNHNITVNIKDGSEATINQDIMMQPGATVSVEEGATLTIAEGKKLYLMDASEWGNYCFGAQMRPVTYVASRSGAPVSRSLTDAKLNVDGSLIVNGQMYATASGAQIVSEDKTGTIEFKTAAPTDQPTLYQSHVMEKQYNPLFSAHGVFHSLTDNKNLTAFTVYPAVLRNGDDTTVNTSGVAAGTVYDYCAICDKWVNSITVTFDANGGENAVTGTMEPLKTHAGCTGKLTANAFAIDGMKFKEWNTVAAPSEETPGTAYADEAVISETGITVNTTLYAQWEPDAIAVVVKGTIPYTVQGQVVTVTHTAACKVGYWDATNSKYVAIAATPNDDGSYSFTAPEGVNEVLLVMKGDINLDGLLKTNDKAALNSVTLGKTTLAAENTFVADINGDGQVKTNDKAGLNAVLLGKTQFAW